MLKNVASQKVYVFAWDSTTGLPKTGDQANISIYLQKDFASPVQTATTTTTQVDSTNAAGLYVVAVTQAETNYDTIVVTAKSSTSNIVAIGAPLVLFPAPAALNTDVAAIKAKTDSLTFTVTGEVNANTRYIKGQLIAGSGSSGDPWHP